jgi:hypothetical protein
MRLSRLLIAPSLLFVAVAAFGDSLTWPAWLQNGGDAASANGDPAQSATWINGDDSSPVTVSQLQWVAESARDYLEGELSSTGGAGADIDTLIAGFTDTDDSTPVTFAQLQEVAEPFYDRLIAAGFDTQASLAANGAGAGWESDYPWAEPPPGPGDPDYDESVYVAWQQAQDAPANLGELKLAFSFDLSGSTQTTIFDLQAISNASASNASAVLLTAASTPTSTSPSSGNATSSPVNAELADPSVTGDDMEPALATAGAAPVALIVLTPLE